MRTKRNILVSVLAIVLCFGLLSGCGAKSTVNNTVTPMEKEESLAVSFDFIGGKDVMPIGCFHGPFTSTYNQDGNIVPDYMTDEFFSALSEAGFNLITASNADWLRSRESLERGMKLGEKYGIGWFVGDGNITGNPKLTVEEAKNYISQYYDYPAFCGMTVLDEPNTPYYNKDGNAARMMDLFSNQAQILQNELGLYCYISMYPNGKLQADQRELYVRYVEDIIANLQPRILMWDFYPWDKGEAEEDDQRGYFWNMDLMRSYSLQHEIPFWAFVQAGSQWYVTAKDSITPYYPNEPQFNWNISTCLAFGVQGFQYFPTFQYVDFARAETTEWDFQRNGIFGAWGNKNQWYHYAKNAHAHIAVIDEVLMNSVTKGVIVNGEAATKDTEYVECIIDSGSFQELVSVTGDTMVGCFNYNGKTALYVVNYSTVYAQYITLNLNDTHNLKVVQGTDTSYVQTDALVLDMAAGEGVLVVIEE